MSQPTDTLLLVEDSPDDYEAVARTLRKLQFVGTLQWVDNGGDALRVVRESVAAGTPPTLVLLDLNMPGQDGRTVLRDLKADEKTRVIPVVIYTTSSNPSDVLFCYQHFANSYQVKPLGTSELRNSLELMLRYWFDLAEKVK